MEEKLYFRTSSPDYYAYLKENSKRMRGNQTMGESALWQNLRSKQLGVKFRRQHAIGDYIADFVCLTSKLIIEVDGEYHNTPQQQLLDKQRTDFFLRMGYKELRFTNDEILCDINRVIETIKQHI